MRYLYTVVLNSWYERNQVSSMAQNKMKIKNNKIAFGGLIYATSSVTNIFFSVRASGVRYVLQLTTIIFNHDSFLCFLDLIEDLQERLGSKEQYWRES